MPEPTPRARVAFLGTPTFAVTALQALLDRPAAYDVVAVFTQPDRPAGRGRVLQSCPVKRLARDAGVACFAPTKLRGTEVQAQFAGLALDVAVVAAYGRILPGAMLLAPRCGCINLHASLLPAYRGASPIAQSILHGDHDTGVSIMQMDEGLDTGAVHAQRALVISTDDTCGSLTERLSVVAGSLIVDVLPRILAGTSQAVPQAALARGEPSYAPLLQKAAGALDLAGAAATLARQVRAFSPWPGTFLQNEGRRLGIMKACELRKEHQADPGTVLDAAPSGLDVACGQGALRLLEVKPAGKNRMPIAAWLAARKVVLGQKITAAI